MQLVCPAGNLPSLKAAVDNGADAVYIGFRDETNARHFAGLNFNQKQIETGMRYARDRGVRVFVAINTFPYPHGMEKWHSAVDLAVDIGAHALILADMGVMDYACKTHPDTRLHLSVQGSATNHRAVQFYVDHFNIRRAVIPRVLSLKQVENLIQKSPVPIEVFGFGSLCVMVEGRCYLSSYVTGLGPNNFGACSPASHVRWTETPLGRETRLNGVLIDRVGANEAAGYPTVCKGRFQVNGETGYAIEEPTSLNTLPILADLQRIGVGAIKIEGRQRSPAYVGKITRLMRTAIDACVKDPDHFLADDSWMSELSSLSEGTQTTLGAYYRPWQ